MPVFNTAPYLQESVSSMLTQDHGNIEFIFINDGSTDNSLDILKSFSDSRMRIVSNEGNKGLVYTLNKGLELAHGEYIARMDGDDVSLPGRISRQLRYLENHPEVDVLATRISLVNEDGRDIGEWADEAAHITATDIRNFLPVNNCIAHPSVMARAAVLKKYGYRSMQAQAEDYDLWLRMAADGVVIHKLDEVLLKHRIVQNSFTRKRQQNVFLKLAGTKRRFAMDAIAHGRINSFVLKTLLHAGMDGVKGIIKSTRGTSPCII